jgi:hypothetical protein
MEKKLKKLNTYKTIVLSDTEKAMIRAHGAHVVTTMVPVVTTSIFQLGIQHGLRIALSTFIFTVFVGSSISVVANSALPGDPLYAFKVNVNEEVKGMFLKTSEEKVVWQKNRIESRVNEIKTLAETETLTKAKQATVQKALNSHVRGLSKELETLSDQAPTAALTVTASLEESLKANKEAIKQAPATVISGTEKADALKAVDVTLKEVSNQEVKILSKEIDNIANEVSNVPTIPIGTLTTPPTTTPVGP